MITLLWTLLVFGTLAATAAYAAEQARWLVGASRRLPWILALTSTAIWPLVQSGLGRLFPPAPIALAVQWPAISVVSQSAEAVSQSRPWLARLVVLLWCGASSVMLVRLALAARTARSALRTGKPAVIDGAPVIVSDSAGPAVVGWVQPRVLWPDWLEDIEPSLRRLILLHEREHCRAHDPRWILAAEFAVVMLPWHPAVWWMRRRLRAAIELDCDARVLAVENDAPRYGRLLVLLAQRQPLMRLASMLAEPHSLLARRILTMTTPRPRYAPLRAAILSAAALAFAVTACSSALDQGGMAPMPSVGKAPAERGQMVDPTKVYLEFQQDEPAQYTAESGLPKYPAVQKAAGIEAEVLTQFVVGTDGLVEPGSFRVLLGTTVGADGVKRPLLKSESEFGPFEIAVRDALPTMRFVPAKLKGVAVRGLIQQPFVFAVAKK